VTAQASDESTIALTTIAGPTQTITLTVATPTSSAIHGGTAHVYWAGTITVWLIILGLILLVIWGIVRIRHRRRTG